VNHVKTKQTKSLKTDTVKEERLLAK